MIVAIESLLPSLLLIALGFGIARTQIMSRDGWEGVERLNYYLLYPMLLFVSVVRADLRTAPVFAAGAAMALGVLTLAAVMVATRRLWTAAPGVDGPGFTSHMQGAVRYNTAVALAVCGALFGQEGLALAALGAVAIVPLINVISVTTLATWATDRRPTVAGLAKEIALNPLIIGTVAGALVNASGIPLYKPLTETLDLIGRGALGIALLLVGAGLRWRALAPRVDVAADMAAKLVVMPLLMAGYALMLGVEGVALAVVAISGAMPTASSAYVLARRMGGDADLMASLITSQTVAAFVTLPVVVWLVGGGTMMP